MFEKLRTVIARAIAPRQQAVSTRMYAGARGGRLATNFGTSSGSADAELQSSLRNLRARSSQLLRDSAYARRAQKIIVDNVIGATGIGMQSKVQSEGALAKTINADIEEQWCKWADGDGCNVGGQLCFADMERVLMKQVFRSGEVGVRLHLRSFGSSKVPLAMEIVEAERLADELSHVANRQVINQVRLGVELDSFFRPVAYYVRQNHPGDIIYTSIPSVTDTFERVPAEVFFHIRIVDRWPQTRGEPWLCAVMRKLNDMDGYSEAEIIAARASANLVFTKKQAGNGPIVTMGQKQADGSEQFEIEPGMGINLLAGEELDMHNPARPNAALDPFMRYMLREMAAGIDVPYSALSMDLSQTNYSSSRLGILEARDSWRSLQWWWIRTFRAPLHRIWLRQAVYSGATAKVPLERYLIDPSRFEKVAFRPRGWDWVDPSKDIASYKEAIKAGLTTRTQVVAQTANGMDVEELDDERAAEIEYAEELGLQYDTDPAAYMAAAQPQAKPAIAAEDPPPDDGTDGSNQTDPQARVVSFRR